ncbi:MAG: DUF3795 domain-containing protein [Lachnospiraceae bacterium]|nr:DUF3795 domain-containing protein [Lachnospiraceae bacterium]
MKGRRRAQTGLRDYGMDYTKIKEEFAKYGLEFPEELMGEGLMEEQKQEINPCGTFCGKCDDYGVTCDGCRNRKGLPLWQQMFGNTTPCPYYDCSAKKGLHDCSQCGKLPCPEYFSYPDPDMSIEYKQWWFRLRMNNLKKSNCDCKVEVMDTYEENVIRYLGDGK